MEIVHTRDKDGPTRDIQAEPKPKPISTVAETSTWISESRPKARKRLPTPAIGNSSAVCSGVSMVSLSE